MAEEPDAYPVGVRETTKGIRTIHAEMQSRETTLDRKRVYSFVLADSEIDGSGKVESTHAILSKYLEENARFLDKELLYAKPVSTRDNPNQLNLIVHYLLPNNVVALLRITSQHAVENERIFVGKEKSLELSLKGFEEDEVKRIGKEMKALTELF